MRLTAFLTLFILTTLLPWYVVLIGAGLYSLYFDDPYELLPLALFVDAYFGVVSIVPVYIVSFSIVLFALEWLKPRLLIYNKL